MIITIRIEEDWEKRQKRRKIWKKVKKGKRKRARQGSSKKAGIGLTGKGVYGRVGNLKPEEMN